MEELTELLITVVIPALITAALGAAVPVLNEKRKQLKAGKSKLLIEILETAINTGIDYFREQKQTPTVQGVKEYVKESIPDTLKEISPTQSALERKIIGEAAKRAIELLR